jgi:NAD(P)-dependent dehydrogenase (short-subunit alcohol dehydrogenase family)
MNLQGRVAIVTGGGPSVGRAVCVELGRAGAAVVAIDLDGEALEQTATEVEFAGGRVETLVADVSSEETFVDALALADSSFGRVDILVNLASVDGPSEGFGSYPLADFDRLMAVNVRGTFLGLKHVLPRLIDQGAGAVVNFSCAADSEEDVALGPYAASRHAVLGLTTSAAREAGPAGVRVNAIRMGPMGHRGCPEEVAEVVRFLVSPWTSANGAVWSLEAGELVS